MQIFQKLAIHHKLVVKQIQYLHWTYSSASRRQTSSLKSKINTEDNEMVFHRGPCIEIYCYAILCLRTNTNVIAEVGPLSVSTKKAHAFGLL